MLNLRFVSNLTSSTLGTNVVGGVEIEGRAKPPWGTTFVDIGHHLRFASLQ